MKPEELRNISESTNELAGVLMAEVIYPRLQQDAGLGYKFSGMYLDSDFGQYSIEIVERALAMMEDDGYTITRDIVQYHGVARMVSISWE